MSVSKRCIIPRLILGFVKGRSKPVTIHISEHARRRGSHSPLWIRAWVLGTKLIGARAKWGIRNVLMNESKLTQPGETWSWRAGQEAEGFLWKCVKCWWVVWSLWWAAWLCSKMVSNGFQDLEREMSLVSPVFQYAKVGRQWEENQKGFQKENLPVNCHAPWSETLRTPQWSAREDGREPLPGSSPAASVTAEVE